MSRKIKTIILIFVLSLIICTPCLAKAIYSNDGRFSFTTSDRWFYTRVGGGDSLTEELLTVALDGDTVVTLKRGKFATKHRTFKEFSYADKSQVRDNAIRAFSNFASSLGCSLKVNRADVFDEAVAIAYHLFREGRRYYGIETFFVKDYTLYSLTLLASEYTLSEASSVFSSLMCDGKPFSQWAK